MLARILVLGSLLMAFGVSQGYADGAVGFYGGVNNSNLSGDTPSGTSYQTRKGLVAGLFGEIRIARDVFLGLHPGYIQKGTLVTLKPVNEGEDPIENDLSLDYFSVPVLFKIETGKGATYFSGGLDFAFLMSASLDLPGKEIDAQEIMRNFDLSMNFAFGGKIPLGSPFLTLELRYSQSLLNVADTEIGDETYSVPARFRSSGFQLLAGLLFPLGTR